MQAIDLVQSRLLIHSQPVERNIVHFALDSQAAASHRKHTYIHRLRFSLLIHRTTFTMTSSSEKYMAQFSEEQIEDYRQAFNMFDRDCSGAISMDELGVVMKNLGMTPSEEELKDMIREHDTDESGQIEFPEFCELIQKHTCEDKEETLKAAFKTFDQDGSGKISAEELRKVMHTLGERLTDDEISEMIIEADVDGDGQINYEEFALMMSSNCPNKE